MIVKHPEDGSQNDRKLLVIVKHPEDGSQSDRKLLVIVIYVQVCVSIVNMEFAAEV